MPSALRMRLWVGEPGETAPEGWLGACHPAWTEVLYQHRDLIEVVSVPAWMAGSGSAAVEVWAPWARVEVRPC